jgi:SAM-dependent methyltransferase
MQQVAPRVTPILERIPPELRERARLRLRRLRRPARFRALRRTTPVSEDFGFDRGTPVDRYYIERFLARHAQDIRGRVLEVMDSRYTDRFGVGVTGSDVLDIDARNPRATLVADLAAADGIATESFDCVILTQTLQYIFDVRAAIGHTWRILRPGGALLCTVPTANRFSARTLRGEYWRFTSAGCETLFRELDAVEFLTVEAPGNVLAGIAFLTGMAAEELPSRALAKADERFPVVVLVRALKRA